MITHLDVFPVELVYRESVRLGAETAERRPTALVRLTDGDNQGWGEAAPLAGFSGESLDDAVRALHALRGALPVSADTLLDRVTIPTVRFALDTALHEIDARASGRPHLVPTSTLRRVELAVASLVGPIPADADVVPLDPLVIKIKVGNPDWRADVRRAREILRAAATGTRVRFDANRRWSNESARAFFTELGDETVDFIEEPADSLESTARLAGEGLPVALDETVQELFRSGFTGAGLVREAIRLVPHVRCLVVKPSLIGAWRETLSIAEAAADHDVRVVVSSAFESGVGLRAVIALAAQNPFPDAAGLDTYRQLREDTLDPRIEMTPHSIDVPDALSLRRRVRADAFSKVQSEQ